MTRLAYRGDDYPAASKKHLDDARALVDAGRHVGCAYLAGYVVECALKSVLLYEASWDPRTRGYDQQRLGDEQERVRQFGHDLRDLFDELTRVSARATVRSSRYVPNLPHHAAIRCWQASLRYRPYNYLESSHAREMLKDARNVYKQTIERMASDQVL